MAQDQQPQFDHYSQSAPEYTETILWHRVYLVIGAGVVVLAAIVWGIVVALSPVQESIIDSPLAVSELPATHSIPKATENPEQPIQQEASAEVEAPIEKEAAAQPSIEEVEAKVADEQINEQVIPEIQYPVDVEILNSTAITSAALTNKMDGLEPATELTSTEHLTDEFIKLYFYTDLIGRAGDTLTYTWQRNNKTVARVRVPVGSDRWRNHSSKNISKNMRGDWQVMVKDKKGNLLAKASFTLKSI